MRSLAMGLLLLLAVPCWQQPRVQNLSPNLNIPPEVSRRFHSEGLFVHYEISTKLNPFYLRADFDGDAVPDYAVLVMNRTSRVIGIAVSRSGAKRIEVLGAGGIKLKVSPTEDGSPGYEMDGFDWMDSWLAVRKQSLKFTGLDRPVTQMLGEGILVEKSEAVSALIYWDGKQYCWLQLSD